MRSALIVLAASASFLVTAANFHFESNSLTDDEISSFNFPSVNFGDTKKNDQSNIRCKVFPGDADWPTAKEWTLLNTTLGGALLRPEPLAAACYPNDPLFNAEQCNLLLATRSRVFIDDALSLGNGWPQGNTCPLTRNPTGNCTRGGYPEYVVNATSARQIQIAVNFARNRNIRLVVKNTGHDFLGRNTGAGALSIWTHHLKDFEYLRKFAGGQAARVSAGLEAWEVFEHMFANNISIVAPRDGTIGVYGGWTAGGGHNVLASTYGLGADQVLSLQAVTADGRFVTADKNQNQDLFYAMRGGGGSTYGILTSAIVRAYPPLEIRVSSFAFNSGNNTEAFWSAVNEYYWFQQFVCEAGGTAYDNVIPTGGSFRFTAEIEIPFKSADDIKKLLQPMFDAFNKSGISVANPEPGPSQRWILPTARDVRPGNVKFSSRLFPRKLWRSRASFEQSMAPVRDAVEGGYLFHGIHMWATKPKGVADNGVNPAFRQAQMQGDLFDTVPPTTVSEAEFQAANLKYETFMNAIRAATSEGGAYYNEADTQEPNWQQSFFGKSNYRRLQQIKKQRDPGSVFWAPQTVGSEGWEVRSEDYFPSQDGPLCRVSSAH